MPRFSDPFDLTVSDNGNIVELRSIDGILGRERVAAAATDDGVVAVPAYVEIAHPSRLKNSLTRYITSQFRGDRRSNAVAPQ